MVGGFPIVPLGRVALPVERPEVPAAGKVYRQIGVKLWGEGAYERGSIDGSQTKYKTLSRVEADDIIVNKIWARNGSVAVVPEGLSGCYASSEFPTFTPIREKLDPRWFHWLTRIKTFWDQCDEKSRGTSGKNRIRPELFLEIGIPLPPLLEQQRIVARIDELASKIKEAQWLRQNADSESNSIMMAALRSVFCTRVPQTLLGEALQLQRGFDLPLQMRVSGPHPVFAANGEIARHIESRVKGPGVVTGRSGSVGAVNYVEGDFWPLNTALYVRDFRGNQPRLIYYLLRSVSPELKQTSSQTAVPTLDRKRAHAQVHVHVPPLSEQGQIIAYLDDLQAKVDALKGLQATTAAELNAMLPSILDKAFKGEL